MSTSKTGPDPPDDVARLRLLLDAFADHAIYMLDGQGIVASWNAGAERMTGYRPNEIVGQHCACFFTDEDRATRLPQQLLGLARSSGRAESEGWCVRKDGTRFWARSLLQPMRTPAGDIIGFAQITYDATEREAAQRALFESERRFRLLVEGVIDYAIYMLDRDGIVTNWNAGAERIKGYTAGEIIGDHFSRFYTQEERAARLPWRALEIAAREGRYEAEGWRVRKDGSRFWASVVLDAIRGANGALLGYAKITRDITERHRAQEAILESERQFRLLVNSVTDYALIMLDLEGIVTNWNAGAERIKGYAAEEIIGQHFSRFYTESDRAAGLPAQALRTARERGRFEAESWRMRKDGSLFWANVVIDLIRDEQGQLIGFAKITRDITEQRNAQRAVEQAQAHLAQAQKIEALGQLTGGVAHDFNNLLMIISGHIGSLKRAVTDDPKALRAAEAIELAAQRGEALTRQLLTFSRRQSLNPVTVELREAIDGICAMLTSSLGAPVTLVSTILPEVWPVEADANELQLAIVNLVLNARDAMPKGGVISLTAENARLRPGDAGLELEGDFVALAVADTGWGIPADILPRVFDPFFTTKRPDKGTGLGLSQAHGFAHQAGGSIRIESTVGKGTCVTLYLPRAAAPARDAGAEDERKLASSKGMALLVEDNPDVLEVSKALLEQLGYTVYAVTEPPAALEAIDRQRFDLVLSDIVMAGPINGLTLARTIRERHGDVPIVLATGYSSAAEEAAGEFLLLRKPYRLAELSRALARLSGPRDSENLIEFPSRPGRSPS